MSLSAGLEAIELLKDVVVIRNKRKFRWGQLTRLKTNYTTLTQEQFISDIPLEELQYILTSATENRALHQALQGRYDTTSKPEEREDELAKDEDIMRAHNDGTSSTTACPVCSRNHPLHKCRAFLSYDEVRHGQVVKDHRYCSNCLASNHQCTSAYNCKRCSRRHNTILHRDSNQESLTQPAQTPVQTQTAQTPVQTQPAQTPAQTQPPAAANANTTVGSGNAMLARSSDNMPTSVSDPPHELLHTALLDVINGTQTQRARAALDSGATMSIMAENLVHILYLKQHPSNMTLDGLVGEREIQRLRQSYIKIHSLQGRD